MVQESQIARVSRKKASKAIANGAGSAEQALTDAVNTLQKAASNVTGEAKHAISASASALADATRTLIKETDARGRKVAKSAATQVKKHPVATATAVTLAAAAAVSLLAAAQKSKKGKTARTGTAKRAKPVVRKKTR
jgi:hypothetical protein